MRLGLVCEAANLKFVLDRSPVLIGRHAAADICLDSKSVHRRHALVVLTAAGWVIHDLRTRPGLTIDDEAVLHAVLAPNTRLKIGTFVFQVVTEPEDDTESDSADAVSGTSEPTPLDEDWIADVLSDDDSRAIRTPCCRIEVRDGRQRIVQLSVDSATILGTAERADLILPARRVSSLHALLVPQDGTWYLHDLKSDAGLVKGERRLRSIPLDSGDRIQLGDLTLRVDAEEEATADEPARRPTPPTPEPSPPLGLDTDLFQDSTLNAVTDTELDSEMTSWLAEASRATREGNHAAACRAYERLCRRAPYSFPFRRSLRESQQRLRGPVEKRVPWYRLFPIYFFRVMARRSFRRRQPEECLDYAEKGLYFDPWNRALLLLEGLIFEQEDKLSMCLWSLRAARQRYRDDIHLNRPIARIFHHMGNFDMALAYWRLVEKVEPSMEIERNVRAILVEKTLREGRLGSEPSDDDVTAS